MLSWRNSLDTLNWDPGIQHLVLTHCARPPVVISVGCGYTDRCFLKATVALLESKNAAFFRISNNENDREIYRVWTNAQFSRQVNTSTLVHHSNIMSVSTKTLSSLLRLRALYESAFVKGVGGLWGSTNTVALCCIRHYCEWLLFQHRILWTPELEQFTIHYFTHSAL